MAFLPRRVWVRIGPVGVDHPSRLMRRHGDDLVLTAPEGEDQPTPVERGQLVVVTWLTPAGVHELVGTLVDTLQERSRWIVRPRGPAVRTQRRAYVRVGLAAVVALRRGEETVRAGLVDVSEGGMRCVTRTATSLEAGDEVETTLELGGAQVDVRARLVRCQPGRDGRSELAFRFVGLRAQETDRIRRFVFARLGRERARGLG